MCGGEATMTFYSYLNLESTKTIDNISIDSV